MKKIYTILIAALISFILVAMKNPAKAATVHANSQTNGTTAITCTSCSITNPGNAVDNNLSTYTTLNVSLGVLGGYAWERMVFPSAALPGVSVGMIVEDPAGGLLTLALLGSLSIRTYNGATYNNDSHSGGLLTIGLLGGSTTKYYVEFITADPFDRVEVRLNAGIASTFSQLRIYDAYFSAAPLPAALNLIDLKLEGDKALLSWSTSQEVNSQKFVVERSVDGENYAALGTVKAAGNSSDMLYYSYYDNKPYSGGISFYRIRQYSSSGAETVYGPLNLELLKDLALKYSVNLSSRDGVATLDLSQLPLDQAVQVLIVRIDGARIAEYVYPAGQRPEHVTLKTKPAQGIYITNVLLGEDKRTLLQKKFALNE